MRGCATGEVGYFLLLLLLPPGEGSEYGKQRREEARRRKRGLRMKRADPDDQPWVLREQKRGGKQ